MDAPRCNSGRGRSYDPVISISLGGIASGEARQFVEYWKQASERAPYGEIDQSSQVVAMAQSIGITFVPLPLIYGVNPDERGKVPESWSSTILPPCTSARCPGGGATSAG
jgi:hypothetical protein